MEEELKRRIEDLADRCERSGSITHSVFLTPAEQYEAEHSIRLSGCTYLFSGGVEDAERKALFFLPSWIGPEDIDISNHIKAVRFSVRFGEPGHRDYLGALMGLGIRRDFLGDILVYDGGADIICMKSIEETVLSLEKAGRWGVKTESISLKDVKIPEKQLKHLSFTVASPRLDAAVSGLFRISREKAAGHIKFGNVSLNYEACLKPDAQVKAGDIISLRGSGKARIKDFGALSRKGRLFINGEIWI